MSKKASTAKPKAAKKAVKKKSSTGNTVTPAADIPITPSKTPYRDINEADHQQQIEAKA